MTLDLYSAPVLPCACRQSSITIRAGRAQRSAEPHAASDSAQALCAGVEPQSSAGLCAFGHRGQTLPGFSRVAPEWPFPFPDCNRYRVPVPRNRACLRHEEARAGERREVSGRGEGRPAHGCAKLRRPSRAKVALTSREGSRSAARDRRTGRIRARCARMVIDG